MSKLTEIDGAPLFSTIEEAEEWGKRYFITNYHEHKYEGSIGYMAGDNHEITKIALAKGEPTTAKNQEFMIRANAALSNMLNRTTSSTEVVARTPSTNKGY